MTLRSKSARTSSPVGVAIGILIVLELVGFALLSGSRSLLKADRANAIVAAGDGVGAESRERQLSRAARAAAAGIWSLLYREVVDGATGINGRNLEYLGFQADKNGFVLRFDARGRRIEFVITDTSRPRLVAVRSEDRQALPDALTVGAALPVAPLASESGSNHVLGPPRLVPITEHEGFAVEVDHFWTSAIPDRGGDVWADVCHVSLFASSGEFLAGGVLQLNAPLGEAARDGVGGLEFSSVVDGTARPEVQCEVWAGPGLSPNRPASVSVDRPQEAFPLLIPSTGESPWWVSRRFEWAGSPFSGVWRCEAKLRSRDGSIVAEEIGYVYLPPEEHVGYRRTFAIPVPSIGDIREVAPELVCFAVNPELDT